MNRVTPPYQRLLSEIPPAQTTSQAPWRGWSLNLLKPQQEFLKDLGKLLGVQAIGFIITGLLGEISSQGDIARDLNWHVTDTYYKTCTQAENAFITVMVPTAIYSLCVCGYFLKKNQEKGNENISPKMQLEIENEIQLQLAKRAIP
ncbi:MAG: hypothetical protein WBD50_01075 [Candidatus Rhabdochlamydia sp.]